MREGDVAMQYHTGAEELEPMGKMSLLSSGIWGNTTYLLGLFSLQPLVDEIWAWCNHQCGLFQINLLGTGLWLFACPAAHWSCLFLIQSRLCRGLFCLASLPQFRIQYIERRHWRKWSSVLLLVWRHRPPLCLLPCILLEVREGLLCLPCSPPSIVASSDCLFYFPPFCFCILCLLTLRDRISDWLSWLCLELRGFPGHRIFSIKTWKVPDQLGWIGHSSSQLQSIEWFLVVNRDVFCAGRTLCSKFFLPC